MKGFGPGVFPSVIRAVRAFFSFALFLSLFALSLRFLRLEEDRGKEVNRAKKPKAKNGRCIMRCSSHIFENLKEPKVRRAVYVSFLFFSIKIFDCEKAGLLRRDL